MINSLTATIDPLYKNPVKPAVADTVKALKDRDIAMYLL